METEVPQIVRPVYFRTVEALEICKIGLLNYFAGTLVFPCHAFMKAAGELRHDLELLAAHFGACIEQVARRLRTIQCTGFKHLLVFFACIDRAENITKRRSAKLQFSTLAQLVRCGACTNLSR